MAPLYLIYVWKKVAFHMAPDAMTREEISSLKSGQSGNFVGTNPHYIPIADL